MVASGWLAASSYLVAYEYFPLGPGEALKWGANAVGTPGGVISWSLIPDGTPIDPSFTDPNFTGTSDLSSVFNQIGGVGVALPLIERVFATWSAVANIQFVQVSDNGAAFNSDGAVPGNTGLIRVGAYPINGFVGAVGYAAPPNGGTTLEGDVLFNLNALFQVAPGSEGEPINYFPPPSFIFQNDFEGLFLHEVGHAIGLAHPASGVQSVMSIDPAIYANINRQLDTDDIAGVQFLYGAAPEISNSTVVGRFVFYNQCAWDGNDAAANASDDAAIPSDKTALLPGGLATFANYTSYRRGINGIMVDILGLPDPVGVSAADFVFKTGNSQTPATWALGGAPTSVAIRPGAGVGGSDRITLIWADGVIQKQWLEVTVLATESTGLSAPEVFYFGNAIGETGNSSTEARVTSADALRVLNNTTASATIQNVFDHNRDGRVASADRLLVLNNLSAVQPLVLLDLRMPAFGAIRSTPSVP